MIRTVAYFRSLATNKEIGRDRKSFGATYLYLEEKIMDIIGLRSVPKMSFYSLLCFNVACPVMYCMQNEMHELTFLLFIVSLIQNPSP